MSENQPLVAINLPEAPAHRTRPEEERLVRWGRPELTMALYDVGVDVVFTPNKSAYDSAEGVVAALRPTYERTVKGYGVRIEPEELPIPDIDVVWNMGEIIGDDVPEVNHPLIRGFTHDKLRFNRLLGEIGITKAHAHWGGGDITAAFDRISSDQVVVKPRKGRESEHVHVGSKQDILDKIANGEINGSTGDWIVEERLLFNGLPVRARDKQQQEILYEAVKDGKPAELRTLFYGRDETGELVRSYVARIAADGGNTLAMNRWIFIDEAVIPEAVQTQDAKIYEAVVRETGVPDMHVALDRAHVYYGNHQRWVPMEMNSVPALVRTAGDPVVAADQARKLAGFLRREALRARS